MKILAHNLISYEKIELPVERAKALRSFVEKLITKAKKQDLASLRYLLGILPKKTAYKLYYEITPRYRERNGGYLRVIRTGKFRQKDSAELALIEFV